jgi:hypothetical protein
MYIIYDSNSQNFSEYPLDHTNLVHYTASICVKVHKLSLQLYKSLFWTLHTFNMDTTYKHLYNVQVILQAPPAVCQS